MLLRISRASARLDGLAMLIAAVMPVGTSLVGREADRVVVDLIPGASIDHDAVAVVLRRVTGVAAARDIPDKVI